MEILLTMGSWITPSLLTIFRYVTFYLLETVVSILLVYPLNLIIVSVLILMCLRNIIRRYKRKDIQITKFQLSELHQKYKGEIYLFQKESKQINDSAKTMCKQYENEPKIYQLSRKQIEDLHKTEDLLSKQIQILLQKVSISNDLLEETQMLEQQMDQSLSDLQTEVDQVISDFYKID